MRLWTIHPKYLDAKGLVAAWREGLLAKKVLEGKTKGYKNHPQLQRFETCGDPVVAINQFLAEICSEAERRGYKFDKNKIGMVNPPIGAKIKVSKAQIHYEYELLKYKLMYRDKKKYATIKNIAEIEIGSLFEAKDGEIESWEKVKPEIINILKNI
jgi:hypothetical protein